MRSSLGFHTLSLFLRLSNEEVQGLIEHFCAYRECTGLIRIRMIETLPGGQKGWREYSPMYNGTSLILPLELKINFQDRDPGINWTIRSDRQNRSYKEYTVRATINPKILRGISDYLTAATEDDLNEAIPNFNIISNQISPVLGTFEQYTLQRIDYCVNFSLNELAPGCSYEQMMTLIKRADIPSRFKELSEYDPISHRMKSKSGSFYLMNGSVHINCYSKYMKYQEQSKKNMENGYSPIPQTTMDASQDIIRFEVQCLYRKAYSLSRTAEANGDDNINKYKSLLTEESCKEVINYYFCATIGWGNWHSLQSAIAHMKLKRFNAQKENRLIEALRMVNRCRSVEKAKEQYQGDDLAAFKRTLKDLSNMGINPVTIPKEWRIGRIWNLLDTYYSKKNMEDLEQQNIYYLEEHLKNSHSSEKRKKKGKKK